MLNIDASNCTMQNRESSLQVVLGAETSVGITHFEQMFHKDYTAGM